jgi:GT2 family glycosyltransferase
MGVDLSVIIVNWNTKDLLLKCLASIYKTIRQPRFEVWLVDNASRDGSVAAAQEYFPEIRVIHNSHNLGFAAANNRALRQMEGRYALLVNTDAVLTEGAVYEIFRFMENSPEAAMACGQLLNPDGTNQNSVANFPSFTSLLTNEALLKRLFPRSYPNKFQHYDFPVEVESCVGACMMIRKAAMNAVGLMDERFFFFFEETDWAGRMRSAGWKVFFVPSARIFHAQGQTVGHGFRSRLLFYRSRYQYLKKWFPQSYPLMYAIIMVRLLINILITGFVVPFTAFFSSKLNRRLAVYCRILVWHLLGCSFP